MTSAVHADPASASIPPAPPGGADVIAARDLCVSFRAESGSFEALRGVDLRIPRGALFVLVGPNGAGKTTLMRCVTGLVRPTGGSLSVFGTDGSGPRARLARMGVLIENPGAYARLDTREYLGFFASFYAIPDPAARIREVCGELGLELGPKPVSRLSQGNRQKLQLARSLLHRPELLLWDEPTDHLDPASQHDVLAYLRSYLSEHGATALVATHRLEQMDAVASHFGFLAQGRLLASGNKGRILDEAAEGRSGGPAPDRFRLGFARAVDPGELAFLSDGGPEGFSARIETVADQDAGERKEDFLDVSAPGLSLRMPGLIKALVDKGLPLASAEPRRATLAEAYRILVGR